MKSLADTYMSYKIITYYKCKNKLHAYFVNHDVRQIKLMKVHRLINSWVDKIDGKIINYIRKIEGVGK